MEHVIFFPAHDGSPAFRRVASLDEAVRLVEHLRNVENVSEVSVHALSEVPLAFKPWYRVELPTGAPEGSVPEQPMETPAAMPAMPAAMPAAETAAMPAAVEEAPSDEIRNQPIAALAAAAAANGHAVESNGASSLGFFAS